MLKEELEKEKELIEETKEELEKEIKSGLISFEQFKPFFFGAFDTISFLTDLKAFSLNQSELRNIAGARALYDTILDVPMFHFILNPASKWAERVFTFGAFGVPIVIAAKKESSLKEENKNIEKSNNNKYETLKGLQNAK